MSRDGTQPPESPILPRALVASFLVVAAAVCIYYVAVKGPKRSAFVRWKPQIHELLNGDDSYTRHGYPNPPIMALLLAPFVASPTTVGMSAWFILKVVLTLVALRWLLLQHRDAWQRPPPMQVAVLALLATAIPSVGDLLHGNINLWILFLVVAAWRAFGVGRPVLAGIILSLAIACKISPALLLLYFGWKREWKAASAAVVGLAAWLFLLPAIWFGWERNLFLLDRWSGLMLKPYLVESRAEPDVRNQSLAGLFQRLMSPPVAPAPSAEDDASEHAPPAINVASLSPENSRFVWRSIVALSMFGLFLLTRRKTGQSDRRWLEHEFALVLLAMLLLSERSWKHHYVTVLPSFVALFIWIACRSPTLTRRMVVALTILAAALPVVSSSDVLGPIAGQAAVELLQAYGVYVWSAFLLIAAHTIVRFDLARRPV